MSNITEKAVECIKVIADNNRCETCDYIDGERVRYRCGHCYCGECVAKVEHCLLCLTPADAASRTPLPDNPAAQRAQNAVRLLRTFEDTFAIDVYKRSRISEQLQVEKSVFPDCIQAPVKYHNKRKSSIYQSYNQNRESTFFPGELISPVKATKMESSLNYVQKWLDTNVTESSKKAPRKPFADLNVNSPNSLKRTTKRKEKPRKADIILDKVKENLESTPKKKRRISGFKSSLTIVESQPLLDSYFKPAQKGKDITKIKNGCAEFPETSATRVFNKTDRDKSKIIDVDPIVIDDSQSQIVDKDKMAWLAVLEANERSPYVSQSLKPECNDVLPNTFDIAVSPSANQQISSTEVPFYKRSFLIETCDQCRSSKSDIFTKKKVAGQPKDVSITIENSRFITTIKVSSVQDKPIFEKHSVPVQTDAFELSTQDQGKCTEALALSKRATEKEINTSLLEYKGKEVPSQDLFTAEIKSVEDHKLIFFEKQPPINTSKVIIEDSDSDDGANESSIIQVTAEIHHSSEQLEAQVLAELDQSEVHQRAKRSCRGQTPNSMDSSDKENFDPNRPKKMKLDKKDTKDRKRFTKIKN